MIVYGKHTRIAKPDLLCRALLKRSATDNGALACLIEWGELEAGVVDALCPDQDHPHPAVDWLRAATMNAARLYWTGAKQPELPVPPPFPDQIEISVPEGYAYYALYPADYANAAIRFQRQTAAEKIVVIGIRSIGTGLSAVVAAALEQLGCQVASFTVRPHGHPFERRLKLHEELASWVRTMSLAWFLVVDEGPGLSGSSFASVASKLTELGIPEQRICLVPAWDANGGSFVSETARQTWRCHKRYVAGHDAFPPGRDLSGGAWRSLFYSQTGPQPAVQPQHERRKFLCGSRITRFAGLGKYGTARLVRAEQLWKAGLGARPFGLSDGYLEMEFLPGRPLEPGMVDSNLLQAVRSYLLGIRNLFPSRRSVPVEDLRELVRVNVEEALGAQWSARALEQYDSLAPAVVDSPTTCVDGRMLLHEWIRSPGGYRKVDSLDHHDDHFFPNCQNIYWDIAGASIEFGLANEEAPALFLPESHELEKYRFYLIPYLSYRMGYCALAAQAIQNSPEAARFRSQLEFYKIRMKRELV